MEVGPEDVGIVLQGSCFGRGRMGSSGKVGQPLQVAGAASTGTEDLGFSVSSFIRI